MLYVYYTHTIKARRKSRFMEQVFQYIDHMSARYIEELAELCSMRSVKGDTDGLYRTYQTVKARLSSLGFSPVEYGAPQESSVLFGRRPVSGKKTLLFYNHYDVVPEGAASAWAKPPFQLTEQDGRLYGRGVSDNKGALLARLQAVEAILSIKGALPVGTAFLLDGDEETGSMTLSRMVSDAPELLREMTDAALSLWASLKDIHEQVLIDGFYDDVLPATQADLDVLQNYPYDEAGMLARKEIPDFILGLHGLELKKKIFLQPSLNINGIESGEPWKGFRHIIPSTASARFSVILVPRQNAEDILQKLRRHLDQNGFSDVEITADSAGFPVRTPVDNPWRNVLTRAAEAVYEKPLTPSITQLGSGPAYLLRTVRPELPIICACGVAALDSGHHSARENILLQNYINGIKFTVATLFEAGRYSEQ